MALIIAIIVIATLFYYSPLAAGVVAVIAAIYFYKSFQRTKYMTDEEVDMAIRLRSIQDPTERKQIKEEIERRINERMAADKMSNGKAPKLKIYLRWLAVLPGALLSAFLAMFPVHWIIMLIGYRDTTVNDDGTIIYESFLAAIPPDVLEYFAYAFFTPFVIIIAGAYIAPSFKFVTAKILAGVLLIIFAYLSFLSGADFVFTGLHFAATIVLNLVGIGAAIFTVSKYHVQWQKA